MIREPIYAALFAKGEVAFQWVTAARVFKHWVDVPAAEQPAFFQVQRRETATQRRDLPTKWGGSVDWIVYVNSKDKDVAPATTLNEIIDALEAALNPGEVIKTQTLGGLVHHCWIEGDIETDEGTLGEQAWAAIPIRFLSSP